MTEQLNLNEQESQKPELPNDLIREGIQISEIPANTFGTRKVFTNLKPEHKDFKAGQQVLPASFVGIPDQGKVFFKKYHEPGEKNWKDGGYECNDSFGGTRAFFLDALMIHPNEMKKSERVEVIGLKKRGRKANPNKIKVEKDPNAPKGKRGRPRLTEGERKTPVYVPNGGKRGRKPLDPAEKERRLQERIAKNPNLDPNRVKGKRGRPKGSLKVKID